MATTEKTKTARRFRVLIGGKHAALSRSFHEKGVLVVANTGDQVAEFTRSFDASNAISRALQVKNEIAESMHAGWKAFDPIAYEEIPTIEEYQIQVAG